MYSSLTSKITVALLLVTIAGCDAGKKGPPAIGEAYVGAATLNLRQDLAPKSPVVGTVKHGEHLEVVSIRRRFVRVRTPAGAIGWTDSRQLLSTGQMEELRRLAESAGRLQSQGAASVYESVNVHTEASRASPSFAQIPENGTVDVIGHRLVPKAAPASQSPVVAPPPPARKSKEKKPSSKSIPPPPMPAPPKLPANWLELSRSAQLEPAEEELAREPAEAVRRAQKEQTPPREKDPVPMEDWSLIRTKDARVGWVLTRLLSMAIPDEVAQYAEGHRITSYFALADVKDGDQTKHYWLWTTITRGGQAYEFDALRVFAWSLKRHRYETAYIEKNLQGYFPVEAHKAGEVGPEASFSIVVDNGGTMLRKSYAFRGYRVNLIRKEPYQASAELATASAATLAPAPAASSQDLVDRLKEKAKSLLKR